MSIESMQRNIDSVKLLQASVERHILDMTGKKPEEITNLKFPTEQSSVLNVPLKGIAPDRSIQQTVRYDLFRILQYESDVRKFEVEIHKKYAIPFACIVFVFIGAPLGIISRRGTFGVGASLSLGFFVFYWACLKGGENLSDRGIIDPWFGMWVANIVLGISGLYLTFRTARENPTIDWYSLLPKSWRDELNPPEEA